ncbi:protein SERAC1 [Dichotomopilus funicola]|uniref:Protein SERAC1 n=1 Tax=Dichotomopilus funicola TaxID=1934379 RepID=A0AAN6UWN5_9PEZI|nr:protein SERAC1 [Dichotomopilus funicola]
MSAGQKYFRRTTDASPAKDSVNATAVALTQPPHTPIVDTSLTAASTLTRKVDDNTVGPLGLSLVYSPVEEPTTDFIFVHGLGGGSRKTWSKTPSPDHFWPQQWLPLEPVFQKVRIHTYGYSCDWTKRNLDICNVHDFGKGLLSEISTSPLLADAETPLVLVGHSMGGLVIKKAYILARQNALYRPIAKRFHTIYFLATPHRGSDSAQLLNNLLRVAGLSRAYIADLQRGSLNSQSINDEFRQYSGDVQLWSFYELRKTSAGIFNALIVDPESATLGYDGERQTPIDANHRSICKFDSPTNPNYRVLLQSFSTTIRDIETSRLEFMERQRRDQFKKFEQYLMVPESPENDLISFQDTLVPGTCDWLLSREKFTQWQDFSSYGPTLFWLRGQPGGGKSTLASHVINHLQKASQQCSYFFFKRGDKFKMRLGDCFRSLAFQMGLADPQVLEKLLRMRNEGVGIDGDDVRSLWRKVFEAGVLAVTPSAPERYWVIDGLDECSSDGSALSFLLLKLEDATSLRVFITSRESEELESCAQRLHMHDGRTYCERLSPSDTLADMDTLIRTRMETWTMWDERDRAALGAKILVKSSGSFLWSVLVLDRMILAHGKEQINRVLEEMPSEMESTPGIPENKPLAKSNLTWGSAEQIGKLSASFPVPT